MLLGRDWESGACERICDKTDTAQGDSAERNRQRAKTMLNRAACRNSGETALHYPEKDEPGDFGDFHEW